MIGFPLCIPVEPAKGGFYGLNLHYLPHSLRAQFLDALYDTTNNDKFDETTRFRLTYDLLKQIRGKPFVNIVTNTIISHVRSSFAKVDSADWEIAIFLPLSHSRSQVWMQFGKKVGRKWHEDR